MARLLIFAFLILILALGLMMLMLSLRALGGRAQNVRTDTMPETLQRIAYVVLIVLMFGVTSGFLGAS